MRSYAVKEIYYTLQGEGANTGRPAVFLRFSGCNLWSGREEDRPDADCPFCDTDFHGTDGPGGGKFATPGELADAVSLQWPRGIAPAGRPLVVCTGGEPLLQLDAPLIEALHGRGFEIAVETNGTIVPPAGIDWLCVSPKAGTRLLAVVGDELKLVFPQAGAPPEAFAHFDFRHFYLQPMDGPDQQQHLDSTVAYCLAHPGWRLSLQTHKLIGLP